MIGDQSVYQQGQPGLQLSASNAGWGPRASARSVGPLQVVSENQLQSRLVETKAGTPVVVDVRVGQSYEVSRQVVGEENVRVKENKLPPKQQLPSVTTRTVPREVQAVAQKAVINERTVEKTIDVIIEKPVPVYREVPKQVDVIVERPVEKIVERDVVTEIHLEKPVDKVVEIPVDRIVEVQMERIIDQPVLVDRVVEVPRQVFVDRPVGRVVENRVFNDRVIEVDEKDIGNYQADQILPTDVKVFEQSLVRDVRKPVQQVRERPVEVPVEVVVQKPVPRMVDVPVERIVEKPVEVPNYIEKIVEVPVDKIVYNKVVQIVEEPEYVTNIIERPVPVERLIEVPVEVEDGEVPNQTIPQQIGHSRVHNGPSLADASRLPAHFPSQRSLQLLPQPKHSFLTNGQTAIIGQQPAPLPLQEIGRLTNRVQGLPTNKGLVQTASQTNVMVQNSGPLQLPPQGAPAFQPFAPAHFPTQSPVQHQLRGPSPAFAPFQGSANFGVQGPVRFSARIGGGSQFPPGTLIPPQQLPTAFPAHPQQLPTGMPALPQQLPNGIPTLPQQLPAGVASLNQFQWQFNGQYQIPASLPFPAPPASSPFAHPGFQQQISSLNNAAQLNPHPGLETHKISASRLQAFGGAVQTQGTALSGGQSVREVVRENIIRREIPKIIQQEVVYETIVPVEKVNVVEEIVEVPIDRVIERPVVREVVKYVEVPVEREEEEENLIEEIQYKEKIVQVKVEKVVEMPVVKTNVIEKPIYIEKVVEKEVLVPVEKIVEVPVDKIVEVPIEVIVEEPVVVQKQFVKEVYYDKAVTKQGPGLAQPAEDSSLRQMVNNSNQGIVHSKIELAKLRVEFENLTRRQSGATVHANIDYTSQNTVLREKIQELGRSIEEAKKGNVPKGSLFGDRPTNDTTVFRNQH